MKFIQYTMNVNDAAMRYDDPKTASSVVGRCVTSHARV
jgi:hypothetical protein